MARTVRAPGNSHIKTLKPEPSPTLWEELDALCLKHGMKKMIKQAPDLFTAAKYAQESGMHPSWARARIKKMLDEGEIEYVGSGINNAQYYRIKK